MDPKKHKYDRFLTLPALLLAVWYLLSVAGIDIHRDHEHGRTYVVWSVAGCDCESIHPEHHCHDCAHAGGLCTEDEDCCSDDFEAVLSLSGADDGSRPDLSAPEFPVPTALAAVPAGRPTVILPFNGNVSPPPGTGGRLSLLCILRA